MFEGLQILLSMFLGGILLIAGVWRLILTNGSKRPAWIMIAVALVMQLWWVRLWISEAR